MIPLLPLLYNSFPTSRLFSVSFPFPFFSFLFYSRKLATEEVETMV